MVGSESAVADGLETLLHPKFTNKFRRKSNRGIGYKFFIKILSTKTGVFLNMSIK